MSVCKHLQCSCHFNLRFAFLRSDLEWNLLSGNPFPFLEQRNVSHRMSTAHARAGRRTRVRLLIPSARNVGPMSGAAQRSDIPGAPMSRGAVRNVDVGSTLLERRGVASDCQSSAASARRVVDPASMNR